MREMEMIALGTVLLVVLLQLGFMVVEATLWVRITRIEHQILAAQSLDEGNEGSGENRPTTPPVN